MSEVYIVLREEGEYSDYQWEIVFTSLNKDRAEDECRDRIKLAENWRAKYAAQCDEEKRLMKEMFGMDVHWWALPAEKQDAFRKRLPELNREYDRDMHPHKYSMITVPLEIVGKWRSLQNSLMYIY